MACLNFASPFTDFAPHVAKSYKHGDENGITLLNEEKRYFQSKSACAKRSGNITHFSCSEKKPPSIFSYRLTAEPRLLDVCLSGNCLKFKAHRLFCVVENLSSTFCFSLSSSIRYCTQYAALILGLVLLQQVTYAAAAFSKTSLIRSDASKQENYGVFTGMENSEENNLHFQSMKFIRNWGQTNNFLLVAGRGYVYMIDPSRSSGEKQLFLLDVLQWKSTDAEISNCFAGKYRCRNFLCLVEMLPNDDLLVCGTNSYSPACRAYTRDEFSSDGSNSHSHASAKTFPTPYSPLSSIVSISTNTSEGFKILSAFKGSYQGNVAKLHGSPILPKNPDISSEPSWMDDAEFVKILSYENGKSYVFYREKTNLETNGEPKELVSRVAQVCTDDTGGSNILQDEWTSFLTAKMECSFQIGSSSAEEFRYHNLTAVSDIVKMRHNGREIDVVYATFTTPASWAPVSFSAICIYTMEDIINLFDTGALGKLVTLSSTQDSSLEFITLSSKDQPNFPQRPGSCAQPGSNFDVSYLSYMKRNPFMFDSLKPLNGIPTFVSEHDVRMTSITVDRDAGGADHTVFYVGTSSGKLLRIRPQRNENENSLLLEDMQVLENQSCRADGQPCNIHDVYIHRPQSGNIEPAMLVAYTDRIVRIPLASCDQYTEQACCSVDPECGWDGSSCVLRAAGSGNLNPVSNTNDVPSSCFPYDEADDEPTIPATPESGTGGKSGHINDVNNSGQPSDDLNKDVYSAGYSTGFLVLAGFIGALLAEVITLAALCACKRRDAIRKKKKRGWKNPTLTFSPGEGSLAQNENDGGESKNFNQSGNQNNDWNLKQDSYFTMGDSTVCTSLSEPSSKLADEMKTKICQSSYSPLTSSSDQDKDVFVKERKKNENVESTDRVFFELETLSRLNLLEDVQPVLNKNAAAPISSNLRSDGAQPPKLPPKQLTSKKSATAAEPEDLFSDTNMNNNNSKFTGRPSALSSLLFPPPPPYPDKDEEEKSENQSLISTPRSLTPPFRPPTPPHSKIGIRKHETFSGPHGGKIKPPVPPKSAAVVRSASLKSPIRNRPPGSVDSAFRNNLEMLRSQGKPESLSFLQKKNVASLPLNRLHAISPFKPNYAKKPEEKRLVAVTPPTVPEN